MTALAVEIHQECLGGGFWLGFFWAHTVKVQLLEIKSSTLDVEVQSQMYVYVYIYVCDFRIIAFEQKLT